MYSTDSLKILTKFKANIYSILHPSAIQKASLYKERMKYIFGVFSL